MDEKTFKTLEKTMDLFEENYNKSIKPHFEFTNEFYESISVSPTPIRINVYKDVEPNNISEAIQIHDKGRYNQFYEDIYNEISKHIKLDEEVYPSYETPFVYFEVEIHPVERYRYYPFKIPFKKYLLFVKSLLESKNYNVLLNLIKKEKERNYSVLLESVASTGAIESMLDFDSDFEETIKESYYFMRVPVVFYNEKDEIMFEDVVYILLSVYKDYYGKILDSSYEIFYKKPSFKKIIEIFKEKIKHTNIKEARLDFSSGVFGDNYLDLVYYDVYDILFEKLPNLQDFLKYFEKNKKFVDSLNKSVFVFFVLLWMGMKYT